MQPKNSTQFRLGVSMWMGALLALLAVVPANAQGESFINLRFYPGEEPSVESRPSRSNPITLSFTGRFYDPPVRFSSGARLSPDEEFIVKVHNVNREGSKDQILALWDPQERAEIAQDLNDPAMFNRNRVGYEALKESAFVLKLRYGPYILFLVQSTNKIIGEQLQIYPIRETGSGYVLTNELAEDRMLELLYDLNRDQIQPLEDPQAADQTASQAP